MSRVFPFDENRTNAPYIMPDGMVDYPLGDIHYYGHGHPSIAAFIQQYTDPERTDQHKARDLETLRAIDSKDLWRELPRDYYIGRAILPFVIKINTSPLPAHEAAGVPIDDLAVKEILVRVAGWSTIERFPRHTITTSTPTPNLTFFDYKLMGYRVDEIPALAWDESLGKYVDATLPEYLSPQDERDATEEIGLIEATFPLHEWWSEYLIWSRCTHPEGCDACDIDRKYHVVGGDNPVMRQLALRAMYFKNIKESRKPLLAMPYETRLHRQTRNTR